jgi:uncharacterized protein (DUF2252 family)
MADPLSSIEVVVAPEATPLPDGGISPQGAPVPVPEPVSIANQEPTPPPGPSLLAKILAYNEGRKPRLIRLKLKRMAHDPFAFFRGSNHLYAEAWPDLRPPDPGPGIVLCGDLHLENFGAYVDDEGELLYDINDFDEAIVGPCSLDLVRCATSIMLASELWRLTPLQASGMVLGFLDRYRATVTGADAREPIDPRVPRLERGPIWEILGDRALVRRADLIDQNTERRKGSRRIARRKNSHPALKADVAEQVRAAVESYGAATGRADFFMPHDVTGRVAGIGSLGLERYLILVAGPGAPKPKRLFDLKQATPSALGQHASRPWPFPDADDASRVIRAERLLQARRRRNDRRDCLPAPRDDPVGEPVEPRPAEQEAGQAPHRDPGGWPPDGPGPPPRRPGADRRARLGRCAREMGGRPRARLGPRRGRAVRRPNPALPLPVPRRAAVSRRLRGHRIPGKMASSVIAP